MTEDTYRERLTDLQLEVEALRAKLKESQEGDTISRQAAIDKINERQRKLIYCFGFDNDMVKIMDIAKSIVIAIPSAQPEYTEQDMRDEFSAGYYCGMEAAQHEQRWISCDERLPKENVYVLVWCGEVKIARIICGISKEQRAKMQEGAIDNPVSLGWNLSNGYFEIKRSESYRTCDENGNNKVPYCWDCIYGEMFGQDVKAWMPLPEPYKERWEE